MGYINKIQIGNNNNNKYLIEPTLFDITKGTPNNNGLVSVYTANIDDFALVKGVVIYLQIHNDNDSAAKLNINNLGNIPIYYKNKKIVANQLKKNYLYSLIYDEAKWRLIGDTSGIWEGNAETSTKANALANLYDSNTRPTDANIDHVINGGVTHFKVTSSMAEQNKPKEGDGNILHFHWDTNNPWDSQLFIPDKDTGHMCYRGHISASDSSSAVWAKWRTLLDSDNYTDYTVTKTGLGASGSWGISITGNATTATSDNNGNVISSTYLKLSGGTITGRLNIKNDDNAPRIHFGSNDATGASGGFIYMAMAQTNSIYRPNRYNFRIFSYNSSTGATDSNHYETYSLPQVTENMTDIKAYNILTDKDLSFSITGNAATATRIKDNLEAISSATNCNIWVSSNVNGAISGVPKYVSGVYVTANTGVITAKGFTGPLAGNVTGNADTATKWEAAQKVYVALNTALKTTSIQGGSNDAVALGVDGTLGTANGGTGNTSYTAGRIIWAETRSKLSSAPAMHINWEAGTTSTRGYEELVIGNGIDENNIENAFGRIALYSGRTKGSYITAADTTANTWPNHVLPATSGWLVTASDSGVGSSSRPVFIANSGVATEITCVAVEYGGTGQSSLENVRVGGLTTARSLWGNNFDGTGDISGNIILKNTIADITQATNVSSGTANVNRQINFYDNKGKYFARVYARADTSGDTHLFLQAGNWYEATQVNGGIDICYHKSGDDAGEVTYKVTDYDNFRTAIKAAAGDHTHSLAITANPADASTLSFAYGTKYKLTAGGSTYTFTTPSLGTTATTAAAGNHNHDDRYVNVTGDTMSNSLEVSRSTYSDGKSYIRLTSNSKTIGLLVGSGGTDRGIYDWTTNQWLCYYDSSNQGHFVGNASTATKLATAREIYVDLGSTRDTSNKVTFDGSANKAIHVNGILGIANGGTGTNKVSVNTIFAGPASGTADAAPSWRTLVDADIPDSLTLTSITAADNMTISTTTSGKTIALSSASTLYLNSGSNASIIFCQGGASATYEIARFDATNNLFLKTGQLKLGSSTQSSAPATSGIYVHDTRNVTHTPNTWGDKTVQWYFDSGTADTGRSSTYSAIMHVKGWSGSYAAHQLSFNAMNNTDDKNLYHRTGVGTTWGKWRTILDSENYSSYALPLTGGTLSGALSISAIGGSYADGIRIHARTKDKTWAGILLCGADNEEDTGTSANSWYIGNNNGDLYFGRNSTGTDNDKAYLRCVNNTWAWNGTASGDISGKANALANLYDNSSRPTDANITHVTNGGVTHFKATSSITSNKPEGTYGDGNILHFHWDSSDAWDSQLFIPVRDKDHMQYRAKVTKSTWENWQTLLDSANYSSYAVKVITSTDNVIPRFDGTTGQIQSSRMSIDDTGIIKFSYNGRYPGYTQLFDKADIKVAEYWYDIGNATNHSTGLFRWREYSPDASDPTILTGHHETYSLPAVNKGLNSDKNYNILTTKDLGFDITGNAATATKLKDACSIWGHSFDGTADISGHFTMKNTSSRYHYFYIKQNNTDNTIGYIMYDSGNLTNVTTGRWHFAAYSPNSTNDTSTTGFAEIYYLPTVEKGLNANQPYNILTTKDMGFDITGNAATATLATKATGDSDGNAINTTYAKLNGADFTGTVWATKASGAVYIGDYRTDTGLKVCVHINSSSTNHGIYSNGYYNGTTFTSDGAWLIYRNNRGITTVNGNCTGSSGSCTGNAATAAKWESARTITLTGSVTGSIPIDGSSDVILNTTTNHSHDDRYLKTTGGVLTNTLTESLTDDGYFMYFSSQKVTCGSLGLQKITSANERVITLTLGNKESTATKRASGAITLYNTNREFIQIKSLYGKVFSNDTDHTYLNINGWVKTSGVTGAVWNDYAEFRKTNKEAKAGQAVIDNDDGSLSITDKRLMPGAQIVSDTFGFSIGETEEAKTPLAVSGRVLAYTYRPREEYHAGMAVCSAPNGTIDIMTREEIQQYPDAIIGIVSEIPDYEEWGTGNVKVNKRIWIKIK